MSKEYDGVIRYSDTIRTNSRNSSQRPNPTNNSKKGKIIKGILIGVGICIIIAIVAVIYIFLPRHPPETPTEPTTTFSTEPNPTVPEGVPLEPIPSRDLGSEFDFNTKKGDLKRIQVKQKYTEDRVRDGEKITTFSNRITNYDIYIINEQNSDEENKYYYKKLYTCSIAIQSECTTSTNEDCEPKKRIDLTNSVRRNLEKKRKLEGNNNTDLKDKPIPVCLFNLTDNDVITSISCPESFPEEKRKSLVLDLYFFRPPGLKRLTKENINNTITKNTVGDKKYIRETNGGICDVENAQLSFCTTDMNTTTDLENNILTYDEEAIMNITLDADNSYIKTKITNLKDDTSKIENLNPQIYEEKLNSLIQKLNPYLKYEELFSKDDFNEFYILSKNGSATLKKLQKRKLDSNEDKMVKKENNYIHILNPDSGVSVDFALMINSGINSDFMESGSTFYIDNNFTEDISSSKESSQNFNQIIKNLYILSKAGNHLATELYQTLNTTIESLTEEINKVIPTFNKFVINKDLSEVFDSTLSLDELKNLPFKIIQESTNLKQKLDEILDNIEKGGIKQNIKILNQNIYDYIDESRIIMNGLFNNLNELSTSLSSPKSKLTEISTYYLNNTPTSYISIIEKAKKIFTNYYKDEYNLVSHKVDIIIKEFEIKITDSITKEMKIINNLYEKIENNNFTIKDANDEDLKTILNNLYYAKNYLKEIKEKIIEKLRKEMDIKVNGYFISDYDMNSNQESFSKIIEKLLKIAEQLDNDEYIDTVFDEVMSSIIRNFTKIMKFMDQQKEELFPLNEDILLRSTFTSEIQNNMKNDITDAAVNISNKIKEENDFYLKEKQKVIKEFLDNNKEDLDRTALELDNLFSAVNLRELAQLYDEAFNSFLEKTKNEIHENYLLSDEYLSALSDEEKTKELLRNFHVDEQHLPYCISKVPSHEIYLTRFMDVIASKARTQGYSTKYNIFKDYFEKSKLYIKEQLYREPLSEYQTFLSQIREILQVFKNIKISDKYPDLKELSFIDDHLRKIDKFYNRLNAYISDDIFNNKYIDLMNEFIETQSQVLDNITDEMEIKNDIINKFPVINNYNYDFCVSFIRKKTYTCVNGAVFYYDNSDYYCLPAGPISDNYKNLSEHSFETDLGVSHFRAVFKEFNDLLNEKIYYYKSKIDEFKKSLLDIETETINKDYTLNYLSPVKELVKTLLSDKYGDEIIKSSYNYYQPNIEGIIEPLLNNISFQWNQYFQGIYTDIENNLDKFKSSIVELPNMANFYLSIINTNITKSYFNSIEKHQKSEFNYTITYYYNILLKLVKSSHQYVISKLPSNPVGFNNIINKRKNEVNDIFNELIKSIEDSQKEALNLDHQLDFLDVAETNFFKINDILKQNDINNNNNLTPIIKNIRNLKNDKLNDEFSLAARFYLQNSESGKQIKELYEQIDQKVFVYLSLERFKDILEENWIFDQDNFIKDLKDILYNSNLEIEKELKTEKEKYIRSLEEEITKSYTKEEISIKINNDYKAGIKSLELNHINEINENINDILDKIKEELTKEAILLKKTSNSYNKDFKKIEERLSHYQDKIIDNLKTNLFSVINTFLENINNTIYINYYIPGLDKYYSQAIEITKDYKEIELLSASYNVGGIINNLIKELTKDYKDFVKYEIQSNYDKAYLEIEKIYENQNWEKLIKEKIDESYNSILLPVLTEVAKHDIGIAGYKAYDLNDNITKDIDEIISIKMDNIKNITDTTKGDNFIEIKKWKKLDFSLSYKTITNVLQLLKSFILAEGEEEKELVDNFLKKIMISNFNELLENIIPSFGNRFFERIISYNENFKISSLYDELKYTLIPTVTYYNALQISTRIKALTKDLKLKIYSLNDLDITAQEKNKEISDLLNEKVNEFIDESQEFLVTLYKNFFINDVSVEQSFNNIIREEILNTIYEVENNFTDNYINYMNKFFKDKLISSYTEVMNKKTDEMVLSVAQRRETLKSKLDDLFSLEPDAVLNDINNKINNTLYSIDRFNSHFKTIQISENLKDFLNNFGTLNIQPQFQRIMDVLNYETKHLIVNTLDKNSKEYKNSFNQEEFIENVNLTNNEIKNKFINNINETIYNYGIEEYPNNLQKEIDRQSEKIRRRRNRLLTEEEIQNDYKEKIADKAIDDTFSKIFISSSNAKKFIENCENFEEFDKIITENINKLNIAYKKSLKIIKDNDYTEDTYNELVQKLINLKNFTLDYYTSINDSFYDLKTFLKSSINDIYNNINRCANLTYNTFSEKYDDLSKVEEINSTNDENLGEISDTTIIGNQNKLTEIKYSISQISQQNQFKFKVEYEEEGEIKKPKITAGIIEGSRPKKVNINFRSGDIVEKVNVEPNNVNFTMSIYYTTKSKDIYVTTITDFESYKYSTEIVELKKENIEKCSLDEGIELCFEYFEYNEENPKILTSKKYKTIPRKTLIEESIVHESNLFE